MSTATSAVGVWQLRSKLLIQATLVFDTAWRIGSGREGQTLSDLGVLLDPTGLPLLPGSSLKGRLRSTCEQLASILGMTACMLDSDATGVECVSDVDQYKRLRAEYAKTLPGGAASTGTDQRLTWIDEHTCDVCKLFGSPVRRGRLRVADGQLLSWPGVIEVRDGVVVDRDSRTAVEGLKYDYETVPAGTQFRLWIELENASDRELALVGAALFEWAGGSSLGGFTSRGLGRFHLENITISGVDFSNPQERIKYLTTPDPEKRFSDRGDWQEFFQKRIEQQLGSC